MACPCLVSLVTNLWHVPQKWSKLGRSVMPNGHDFHGFRHYHRNHFFGAFWYLTVNTNFTKKEGSKLLNQQWFALRCLGKMNPLWYEVVLFSTFLWQKLHVRHGTLKNDSSPLYFRLPLSSPSTWGSLADDSPPRIHFHFKWLLRWENKGTLVWDAAHG